MEKKLQDIIIKIKHEDVMNMCLLLNDDVQKTIKRYKNLKHGQRPDRFNRACVLATEKPKMPEPEISIPPAARPEPVQAPPVGIPPPEENKQSLEDMFASDPQPEMPQAVPEPPKEEPKTSGGDLFDMDFGASASTPAPIAPAQAPTPDSDNISKLTNIMANMELEK